ncbi:MAG TPA: hypothetical protein VGP72_12815 [Planctomycetota bacterium]
MARRGETTYEPGSVESLKAQLVEKVAKLGSFHPDVLEHMAFLGDTLCLSGEIPRADAVYARTLELATKAERPVQARLVRRYCRVLRITGRASKAAVIDRCLLACQPPSSRSALVS